MSRLIVLIFTLFCFVGPAIAAEGNCSVETIDARAFKGSISGLKVDKLTMIVGDKRVTLPRAELSEIVASTCADILSVAGTVVVATNDGHHLAATGLGLSGEQLTFDCPLFVGRASVRLDRVRSIYRPGLAQTPAELVQKCRDMKLRDGASDVLLVEKADKKSDEKADKKSDEKSDEKSDKKGREKVSTRLVAVKGTLRGIENSGDNAKVVFNWQGKDRRLAMRSVRAILVASAAGDPNALPAIGAIIGRDGSSMAFAKLEYAQGRFKATDPSGTVRTIEYKAVASVRFVSDRVVELSGLKPSAVVEHGFFDGKFPHRVNLSVAGKAITLGGKTYRSGLGLHSYCQLTYQLDGAYEKFVTVVGIDDAVRPAGSAGLSILADGRGLAKPLELSGKDKPQTLRLDVKGVKELTIRVDFGSDRLDISDHVDLAAARLIKPAK